MQLQMKSLAKKNINMLHLKQDINSMLERIPALLDICTDIQISAILKFPLILEGCQS